VTVKIVTVTVKIVIDSKTRRVARLINRFLFHVINSLLLTVKNDSIIDCKTRIFKCDSIIDCETRILLLTGKYTSIIDNKM
jgi:hypothetical protein